MILWIAFLHVGALSALFCFTWKGVALTLFLGWFTGAVGITLGYHRYLTHGSFATTKTMRRLLAFIGGLAGEGPALMWVAVHRKHHEFSDHEGDPLSPREASGGVTWCGCAQIAAANINVNSTRLRTRPCQGSCDAFLDKTFILWHFVLGAILFAIGYFGWDLYTACSFVAYGMFVRLVYVLHITWFVNSATHMWGYRNYETTDDSRNLWWVGLLAYGEGWHNNHHAYQRVARHGHQWWEFDMTYWMILRCEAGSGLERRTRRAQARAPGLSAGRVLAAQARCRPCRPQRDPDTVRAAPLPRIYGRLAAIRPGPTLRLSQRMRLCRRYLLAAVVANGACPDSASTQNSPRQC